MRLHYSFRLGQPLVPLNVAFPETFNYLFWPRLAFKSFNTLSCTIAVIRIIMSSMMYLTDQMLLHNTPYHAQMPRI